MVNSLSGGKSKLGHPELDSLLFQPNNGSIVALILFTAIIDQYIENLQAIPLPCRGCRCFNEVVNILAICMSVSNRVKLIGFMEETMAGK